MERLEVGDQGVVDHGGAGGTGEVGPELAGIGEVRRSAALRPWITMAIILPGAVAAAPAK